APPPGRSRPATPAFAGWREALERSPRHRNARNLDPHPPQFTVSGDKQGGPVLPAKAHVGHMLVTGEDGSQGLARAINNPDAPGSGAIHVPFRIHLHAVGDAGALVTAHVAEDPVR